MQTFNFPYHVQNTEYPESGTRVQLGNGYIFTSPPNGPDLRRFTLKFETMKYFISTEPTKTNFVPNSALVGSEYPIIPAGNGASTITDIDGTAPDGSLKVRRVNIVGSSKEIRIGDSTSGTVNTQYTGSVYIRTRDGSTKSATGDVNDVGGFALSITPEWKRFSTTSTNPTEPYRFLDVLLPVGDYEVWGAQIETGGLTSLIPTTNAAATRTFGTIDYGQRVQLNMAVLENFYKFHKLHRSFIYPHPVYGNTEVKFYSPLKIPEGIVGGDGALKDFSVELIEIIQ